MVPRGNTGLGSDFMPAAQHKALRGQVGSTQYPSLMPGKRKAKTRSTKGALVKGVSKPLPIEILSEPMFREELRTLMRGYSGLYALYRGKKLYYVGLANNLFGRLHHHTRNRHRNRWNRFSIYRVSRVRFLKDIEALVLRISRPPGNSVSGNFHPDADMTRALKKIERSKSRTLTRIRRTLREKA